MKSTNEHQNDTNEAEESKIEEHADDDNEKAPTKDDDGAQLIVQRDDENNNESGDDVIKNDLQEMRKEARRLYGLALFSCLYTFLFVGAFFGWYVYMMAGHCEFGSCCCSSFVGASASVSRGFYRGPMQLMLEDNGSFSSKCDGYVPTEDDEHDGGTCPAQSSTLVNIHFIGQITQMASPLLGYMIDRYRVKVMAFVMAGLCWLGLVFLILGAAYMDALLYPAFLCLGLSTYLVRLCFFVRLWGEESLYSVRWPGAYL